MINKENLISGFKWSSFESLLIGLFGIIRIIILTKFLNSTDFGLMALVLVVTGFSKLFKDFGISNAVIYFDSNNKQLNSLAWINVMIGLTLTLLIVTLGWPISVYLFSNSDLYSLLVLVSPVFFIDGFSIIFLSLMKKKLFFDRMAKIRIIAFLFGFLLTITLAYNNYGVYSLVFGYISERIINSTGFLLLGKELFSYSLYFNLREIKSHLHFGFYQFMEKLTGYFSKEGDNLVIGVFLSTELLGIYSLAKTIVKKPILIIRSMINKMVFPVYTKIKSNDKLMDVAFTLSSLILFCLIPFFFINIFYTEALINLIYGDRWFDVIPFVKLLSILFIFRLLRTVYGPILISRGRSRESFVYNLVGSLSIILTLTVFLNYFNLESAIIALAVLEFFLLFLLTYKLIFKSIFKLKFSHFSFVILKKLLPILMGFALTYIMLFYFEKELSFIISLLFFILLLTVNLFLYPLFNFKYFKLFKKFLYEKNSK